ncbi:SSS family transporter [Sphingomonas jinjuensis]|uniref:SSS family transporter n=1 Tax=Sphingomonas jinjuensis TaxID=535907 RepID=A0A840FFU7_9SPHN|nr:sodium:solute symporter [Sphingomonas jinjuensis]MBB4155532.1 SSS family transporter [Sphingomonas jinjuensis]
MILFRLIALLLFTLGTLAPAQAQEPVSALKATAAPPLPAIGATPLLATIDGRPLVIDRDRAWMLDAESRGWTALDARALAAAGTIRLVASPDRPVALFGGSTIDRAARLTRQGGRLVVDALPALPRPITNAVALAQGDATMIAGLADGVPVLWRLDAGRGWTAQPPWPNRVAPTAIAHQNGALYLLTADGAMWRWTGKTGWQRRTPAPGTPAGGFARPVGQANLLFLLKQGSASDLYAYSGITDAWSRLGWRQPAASLAVPYGAGLFTLARNPGGWRGEAAELQYQRRPLGWLDWTIVVGYLVAMLAIGCHFWRRSRMGSTSEFFLGSRAIPFWAAGVSMFAGNTSSISYLAVPAKAFDTDWQYMMSKIVTVVGLIIVAFWVIPMFRRLNLVSVFSYLETRFHPAIRMLSSALAILMHVGGRMGVVLFLPALAIGTITGTNVILCILVIGVCTIVYTALGGMKAVIWTDFFQVVVLMGGAIFAIGFMIHAVGFAQIVDTAAQFDKTKLVNVSTDFTTPTLWGFIILITFDTVLTFPKDQVLMQRALSTPSAKEASRSVWTFAAILLPGGFIFYIIGTTLFAYYRANPGRLDPLLPVDAVFPAFIGTELPHGVTGIIIAGLFAAAMGTLSGTINSVATLLSVDFYARLRKIEPTQKQSVRFAEWMTVLVGLVGVAIAIVLSRLDVHSLLDLTIELFGLLGGSCAGSYTLGMFTTRANWQGVAIGIVAASLITLIAWLFGLVHPYFYLAIAIVASIVIGYVASLFFPPPAQEQLQGLTIFTGNGRGQRGEAAPSTSVS